MVSFPVPLFNIFGFDEFLLKNESEIKGEGLRERENTYTLTHDRILTEYYGPKWITIYTITHLVSTMQIKEVHINLPKHLAVRLEDAIIEKYGYKARGALTLLILEAIEEKFNPNNKHPKTEKNELAQLDLTDSRINSFNNTVGILSVILPDIIKYSTKPDDNSSPVITIGLLHKAIKRRFQVYDKRAIQRYVDIIETAGIIGMPEADERNRIVSYNILKQKNEIILENVK